MKFPSIHYVNRQESKCPNCTLRCLFRILLQVIQIFFSASVLRVRDSVVFVLENRMVKLKPGSPNKSIVRKQG